MWPHFAAAGAGFAPGFGGNANMSSPTFTGAPPVGTSTWADQRIAFTIIRRNASIWKFLYG